MLSRIGWPGGTFATFAFDIESGEQCGIFTIFTFAKKSGVMGGAFRILAFRMKAWRWGVLFTMTSLELDGIFAISGLGVKG